MSGHVQDLLEAEDQMYAVIHGVVLDSVPDLFPQAPEVFYQGVAVADAEGTPPIDKTWLRVSYTMDQAGQSTLSEQGHSKRWGRSGNIYIQFFSPVKDPTALKTSKKLAILAQRAYESAGSQCGMIFKDIRIDPVGPTDGWFQINLVARYEYEEFH